MVNTVALVIVFDEIKEVAAQVRALEHLAHLVHELVGELPVSECFVENVDEDFFLVGMTGQSSRWTRQKSSLVLCFRF